MRKLIFGMMQSLDGYVAGVDGGPRAYRSGDDGGVEDAAGLQLPPPGHQLGRYFSDFVRGLSGIVYGRRMYEVMRYWDDDQADWGEEERDFALAWRAQPKWVASRTLKTVGPNATLIPDDVGAFVRELKAKGDGELDVAGPELAGSLSALGLIDEYRLYLRPFVLGGGKPFFAGALPPLRLVNSEFVAEDAMKLTYVRESPAAP